MHAHIESSASLPYVHVCAAPNAAVLYTQIHQALRQQLARPAPAIYPPPAMHAWSAPGGSKSPTSKASTQFTRRQAPRGALSVRCRHRRTRAHRPSRQTTTASVACHRGRTRTERTHVSARSVEHPNKNDPYDCRKTFRLLPARDATLPPSVHLRRRRDRP